jgi:hypothetical protein
LGGETISTMPERALGIASSLALLAMTNYVDFAPAVHFDEDGLDVWAQSE